MAFVAQQPKRRTAGRRDLLESLENRQLMAAFDANFNFQPASSATPAGYIADAGHTFNWRNGQQYGWNVDNTANTKDRNTAADARYDSFAMIGKAGGASKWEVAVPNGSYRVQLTAGDASATDSHYGLAVEGVTVLNETPTAWNKWSEASATVNVWDGRLTLTGAAGAWNNKITSIQISGPNGTTNNNATGSGVRVPSATSWSGVASVTSNSAVLQWGDGSNNESGFIVERSTDGWNFAEAGRVGANATRFTATGLNASTRYTFRVRAYNAAGTSAAGATFAATTLAGPSWTPAPGRTGWTGATLDGNAAVRVTWGDVSNESGYAVQRSTDGWTFSDVGRVGANVTNYRDASVAASSRYFYRIQSFNGAGSAVGSTVAVTTPARPSNNTAPAAVGWLGATASGQNAANLTWGDVANESGYIIERSTDGWTFAEAGRVGANVTSFAATGLSAGSRYIFRVKAFNGSGTAAASAAQTIWTANAPTWNPTTPPAPTNNGGNNNTISNKMSLSGISANGNGTNAFAYKSTLDDVGIKNVRIWYSSNNWNAGIDNWYVQRAASYKAAGYTVMLAVLNPNPTDFNTAKSFFQRLAGNATLRNSVDYWQVNNEPNHGQFWHGSLQQYVANNLKPAYEALKAVGETVVGAGPTWDANALRTMVSYGYNNYCDYAAFHPYGDSAAQVIERANAAKAAVGNKPIMFTEWNIAGLAGNVGNWTTQLNTAAAALSRIGSMNYYFAMVSSYTNVGQGGLLNMNGTRNTAFYNTVKNWLR